MLHCRIPVAPLRELCLGHIWLQNKGQLRREQQSGSSGSAGLWHADEEDIVNTLLDRACEGLNEALATGDRYRARLLLRLLAALTTANVVSMPSMFSMLTHIVSSAMSILQKGLETGARLLKNVCFEQQSLHVKVTRCSYRQSPAS